MANDHLVEEVQRAREREREVMSERVMSEREEARRELKTQFSLHCKPVAAGTVKTDLRNVNIVIPKGCVVTISSNFTSVQDCDEDVIFKKMQEFAEKQSNKYRDALDKAFIDDKKCAVEGGECNSTSALSTKMRQQCGAVALAQGLVKIGKNSTLTCSDITNKVDVRALCLTEFFDKAVETATPDTQTETLVSETPETLETPETPETPNKTKKGLLVLALVAVVFACIVACIVIYKFLLWIFSSF